jgi:hypothetical protein
VINHVEKKRGKSPEVNVRTLGIDWLKNVVGVHGPM